MSGDSDLVWCIQVSSNYRSFAVLRDAIGYDLFAKCLAAISSMSAVIC